MYECKKCKSNFHKIGVKVTEQRKDDFIEETSGEFDEEL